MLRELTRSTGSERCAMRPELLDCPGSQPIKTCVLCRARSTGSLLRLQGDASKQWDGRAARRKGTDVLLVVRTCPQDY